MNLKFFEFSNLNFFLSLKLLKFFNILNFSKKKQTKQFNFLKKVHSVANEFSTFFLLKSLHPHSHDYFYKILLH